VHSLIISQGDVQVSNAATPEKKKGKSEVGKRKSSGAPSRQASSIEEVKRESPEIVCITDSDEESSSKVSTPNSKTPASSASFASNTSEAAVISDMQHHLLSIIFFNTSAVILKTDHSSAHRRAKPL
jgi:hypothetical protein